MRVRARRRRIGWGVASSALILVINAVASPDGASAAGRDQPPKGSQTVVQQKIDSRLLRETERARRGEKPRRDAASGVEVDGKGRALVEIRCDVTPAIQKK